ncbi:MAG: hypothetical protein WBB39_04620 [Candidatus Saccharimonadales bacterium]
MSVWLSRSALLAGEGPRHVFARKGRRETTVRRFFALLAAFVAMATSLAGLFGASTASAATTGVLVQIYGPDENPPAYDAGVLIRNDTVNEVQVRFWLNVAGYAGYYQTYSIQNVQQALYASLSAGPIPCGDTVTVTATVEVDGVVLLQDGTQTYTRTAGCGPITTATPTSPTQTTVVGAGDDTITPPTITGVVYSCTGWKDVNGTYTNTCTTTAAAGYQLPAGATTTWTFTDGVVPTTDTWTYGSWDQKHGADKLPCVTGGHWVLTGQGITAAQVKVGGDWVAMTQNGQGSWSYTSTGTVTSTTVLEYRYEGDPKSSVFTLLDCTVTPPPPVDVCPKLDGVLDPTVQTSMPAGYEDPDKDGNCTKVVTPPVDVCPKLDGVLDPTVQTSMPAGYEDPDKDGNCVTPTPKPTPTPTHVVVVVQQPASTAPSEFNGDEPGSFPLGLIGLAALIGGVGIVLSLRKKGAEQV